MKQKIYFIRHCEPNYDNHNDRERELTEKGLQDCQLLIDYFSDKKIDKIFSSPYKRAYDTVFPLSEKYGLEIQIVHDFRERKIDSVWIDDFTSFTQKQWLDFSYKLSDGESLQEVQDRNIAALSDILRKHHKEHIVIGSHGTAISTIINYFIPAFNYNDFNQIKSLMPFVLVLTFEDDKGVSINLDNIFTGERQILAKSVRTLF
ncbi:histidine phosphatase family protein [Streptococcus plurextorum]|uniref:histidine phosphatase family protein n=1 Tax=Streptococcus plurextorum TaxID=456876 RepID=UPI000420BE3B|nr:histidine phosphatase family protein [Streptococcus plurextorum]